ncbi:hypothetical protein CTI12_AA337960 [Artemisia annua]|uniref:Uncharacterized protein n=1 Tax=Artemisia annua TaxID=35608 RepID=A0A2U1MVF7_ARTAN|nr:hypothetical protein CTI12_AA337960 [Artemisia annua]
MAMTNNAHPSMMMESGLLPKDVAKKLFEAKKMKKLGPPMKTVVTVKRQSDSSVSVKKTTTVSTEKKKTPASKAPSVQPRKRKIFDDSSDEGSDDDFVSDKKKTTVSTEKKKAPPSKAPSVQPKKRKIVDESSRRRI